MPTIRMGFLGFGKTGQEVVREFLSEEGFEVVWVIRKTNFGHGKFASRFLGFETNKGRIFSAHEIEPKFFDRHPVDVIVDFSSEEGIKLYRHAAERGIKIISAISNYQRSQLKIFDSLKRKTAVLYSPNITLGINFLLVASQLLQKIAPHADIEIIEEHFRAKKDVSGTALKIAKALGIDRKRHVNSVRVGGVVGRHEVVFGLPNQTLRLVHESINRRAFGRGAIFAAKWLVDQPKGFYSMENIITGMMRENLAVY